MAKIGHASALGAAFVLGMALAPACGDSGTFACVQNSQCVADGAEGTCQDNGACSFPDPACVSGQRYGDLVGGALAGMCVPEGEATGTSPTTDGPAPTSGDSDDGAPPTTVAIEDGGDTTTSAVTSNADGPGDDTSSSGSADGESSSTGETPVAVTLEFSERSDADVSGVTVDTYIGLSSPGYNGGAHNDLHVVQEGMPAATLIAFDVSAIPPGSQVLDATLEVWTEETGYLFAGHVEMRRMLEPWDEGSGDHSDGIANWTERTASDPWTDAGAEAPGSSEATVLGTLDADAPRQAYTVTVPADVVQDWVDAPEINFGLRLAAVDYGEDYAWYLSSEHSDDSRRPALLVTFLSPAP